MKDWSRVGFYYRHTSAAGVEPRRVFHSRFPRRLRSEERLGVHIAYGTFDLTSDKLDLRYCGESRT
jgi:hypothetical protein